MPLAPSDRDLVVAELGRDPTPSERALFENLWSEHCAYRSSRPLLGAFESDGEHVVVGPGDDAAVISVPLPGSGRQPGAGEGNGDDGDRENEGESGEGRAIGEGNGNTADVYLTFGIESHNHPSYVDPYDGAATGVGGIVRDTLSMGAYPIALADCLYFGSFDREHSRYLFEGVVEGIGDYGNAIGVPTVAGSVAFHPGYEGNPLVNVACVGLCSPDRLVTARAAEAGNALVLVGNATGRDGLGGASFASEDLSADAETEDRPAVQVGDPYAEKLLIEANETLLDRDLVVSARDLGAAGLGGATAELVAKGGLGARIDLERVHQREPGMNALEILLAESQERMCYEVRPEDVEAIRGVAERYDLGCSVIGEVTDGNYVCRFEGETVVDVPAALLADGAPANDLPATEPEPRDRELPSPRPELSSAFETVVGSPNTASKEWVYRQYDHEVGVRTATRPGDDAALLALREAGVGVALTAGADPNWTDAAPYEGARAVALENATNLAAKGATPLAAVDCLNGGNPERADVYGGFAAVVDGLADMCADLDVPVVGGNVSLYNDSPAGPVPPTPTVAMVGTGPDYSAPPTTVSGDGDLLVVGDRALAGNDSARGDTSNRPAEARRGVVSPPGLGGSEYLARFGGSDRFPAPPQAPKSKAFVDTLGTVANREATRAVHDVSHGGLAVTFAEMVGPGAGLDVAVDGDASSAARLFHERTGRAVVETTDPGGVRRAFDGVAPVAAVGTATSSGILDLAVGEETLIYGYDDITALRDVLSRELD